MKVGEDYIGVTVSFTCHDGQGNILMHKRSKNCRDEQGRWDCGGGQLEFGETWEDAVKREIKEEYGTIVKDIQFVNTLNVLRENNGKPTHWIALLFVVRVDPKKIKIGEPEKMDEIGWFRLGNLPRPLHSVVLKHIEKVREFI